MTKATNDTAAPVDREVSKRDIARRVTIGWFPRERFSVAAESLRSLIEHTPACRLIIVDCDTPPKYLDEVKTALGDRPAEIVSTGRHILPSAARNLVIGMTTTEYVALVENDVLFAPGWLETLVAACDEEAADVASPILFEGREQKEHFDKKLGHIRPSVSQPGKFEITPLTRPRNSCTERTVVDFVEQHCLVFRMRAFERTGGFNELNTRDDIDLGMALHVAGCRAVLEPAVKVNFVGPSWRPADDELPFFRFRWDLEGARRNRDEIRDRWNLVETPGDMGFVTYRNLMARLPEVQAMLRQLDAAPGATVLMENGDWFGTDMVEGLSMRPFPDRDGQFGGFPASDEAAVAALDRALAAGRGRVVIGFPAFWWLDHLPALRARLAETCRTARSDDLLQVFEVVAASAALDGPGEASRLSDAAPPAEALPA